MTSNDAMITYANEVNVNRLARLQPIDEKMSKKRNKLNVCKIKILRN